MASGPENCDFSSAASKSNAYMQFHRVRLSAKKRFARISVRSLGWLPSCSNKSGERFVCVLLIGSTNVCVTSSAEELFRGWHFCNIIFTCHSVNEHVPSFSWCIASSDFPLVIAFMLFQSVRWKTKGPSEACTVYPVGGAVGLASTA